MMLTLNWNKKEINCYLWNGWEVDDILCKQKPMVSSVSLAKFNGRDVMLVRKDIHFLFLRKNIQT